MSARPHFGRVFHVEGMDLAGKSTVTRSLARRFPGCRLSRNAMTANNAVYKLADELRRRDDTAADVLGHLYVAALLADLDALREPPRVAIQDSTILLRSLAFNHVLGLDRIVSALLAAVPRHPRFGVTIVLTASLEARLGRLDERARTAPTEVAADDLMIVRAPETFLAMERTLVDYARGLFDAVIIDTSDLTAAEVHAAVAAACTQIPVAP